jgi:quercetin dioxygenase-like cupin family protein
MAFAGQVLDNPISGERITFRKTAADTDGELLAVDLGLRPDGHVPGAHVHPTQEERFEIVTGTMKFQKGLKIIMARAGDTVVIPPGTVHRFENAGDGPAHARVEVRPALRMEELFETTVALAERGERTPAGRPIRSTWHCSCESSTQRSELRSFPRPPCVPSWRPWRGWPGAGASTPATASRRLAPPRPGAIRGGPRHRGLGAGRSSVRIERSLAEAPVLCVAGTTHPTTSLER